VGVRVNLSLSLSVRAFAIYTQPSCSDLKSTFSSFLLTRQVFGVEERAAVTPEAGCMLPAPIVAQGVHIQPLPVWHGTDCVCFGYAIELPE
jgi:hypothetical protein